MDAHRPASIDDFPQHVQVRLRLDDPVGREWVQRVLRLLSRRFARRQAVWWWLRPPIAGKAPVSLLRADWQPGDPEACLGEAFVRAGFEGWPAATGTIWTPDSTSKARG